MEFLRVAGGEAATSLAVLRGDDESLPPRARALAQLAITLTANPWLLTREEVAEVSGHGFDEEQIEAAIVVISLFNYYTRVADASGIDFDYESPLPAFKPDVTQAAAIRPHRSATSGTDRGQDHRRLQYRPLQSAWDMWRSYVMEAEEPMSRRERQLLAVVAAEESGDWEGAETLGGFGDPEDGDKPLTEFARKLSRQPWTMEAGDLAKLRAAGYSEIALLHTISVVAHQNANSRLGLGLRALG